MNLPGPIEWEGEETMLVRYLGLPRAQNFPFDHERTGRFYEDFGRKIDRIYVHQTASSPLDGRDAPEQLARWYVATPRYAQRDSRMIRVGGGRGFPALGHTFLVPTRPAMHTGKFVVYRLWTDEWVTWHTRRHNRHGVSVAFAGNFATRYAPRQSKIDPSTPAISAGEELIRDYLLPRYSLAWDDVSGHFEAGRPTCPGDVLEAWVRRQRGETVGWLSSVGRLDRRPLETLGQKCDALGALGFGDGETLENFRTAVESFQAFAGVTIDGVFGQQTERALRARLRSDRSQAVS